MISLSDPILGEIEKQALCSVIDSGWLTMGDRVATFEKNFAELHGTEGAVAVNSCTAGLHLCLLALGIGPGDEVLVPSLTFVATANAILYINAKPVFVDIENIHRPHISLEDAKAKFTPRTKAIIIMHYGGYLMDLPVWRKFADEHGLYLIEDAAHAPAIGQVGQWGDASAFSFFTNKNMTTSEGGMVTARNSNVLAKVKQLRSHGMTTTTLQRDRGHAYSYDVTLLGYNYRLDELRAAMGIVQLQRVVGWNERRRQLTQYYRALLAEHIPTVMVPFSTNDDTAAHLMPVVLPADQNREIVMARLRESGIQSSIHYPPIHHFSYYREKFPEVVLPKTEDYSRRVITIPLHPALADDVVVKVVMALKDALA